MNIEQEANGEHFKIKSDWAAQSKGLQGQYPLLSDADVRYEAGKENELLCRLETRLNMCREEVLLLLQHDVIVVAV
jgi:hypothetical protein